MPVNKRLFFFLNFITTRGALVAIFAAIPLHPISEEHLVSFSLHLQEEALLNPLLHML